MRIYLKIENHDFIFFDSLGVILCNSLLISENEINSEKYLISSRVLCKNCLYLF